MESSLGQIQAGFLWHYSVKSLVWYPKKHFDAAGYHVPRTWDDLIALTKQIADKDGTPWRIGIKADGATGWPATDWIEDIMLRTTSTDEYFQRAYGALPFTDPRVKHAFEI